jgi:hypothetical protein
MASKKFNMASKTVYAEYITVEPQKDKRQKYFMFSVFLATKSSKEEKRKNTESMQNIFRYANIEPCFSSG